MLRVFLKFGKRRTNIWFQYFKTLTAPYCKTQACSRVRRGVSLIKFHHTLTGDCSAFWRLFVRFVAFARRKHNQAFFALCSTVFSFQENGVTDDEIKTAAELFEEISDECIVNSHGNPSTLPESGEQGDQSRSWTLVVNRSHFRLWSRPVEGHPYQCEYRAFGTYKDLSANAFFAVQVDVGYRKQWDHLVLALDVVAEDKSIGADVVRWISYFPYPLYPREYLFARRVCVDLRKNMLVLISRSIDRHPNLPEQNNKCVRVHEYRSVMVVRPHSTFDENGFDYVLTYFDDPQAAIPSVAYSFAAKKGLPNYLDNVYNAAKKLTHADYSTITDSLPRVLLDKTSPLNCDLS